MYKTVIEIITEQAEVSKGKDAVICHNEKTTYSQLIKFSILFYKMIQGFDLKNKAIIIFLPRGKNLIASMLATLNTDGYFVAIDVSYPENRIDEMIKSVNAAVIITDNSLLKRAKHYNVPCVVIDGVLNERSCEKQLICNDCLNSEQLAYCIFTSGSTGHPKGVLIKDNSLYWLIRSFKEKFSLNSYSSILCSSTQCFDMFIVETLVALSLGLTVVLTTEDESKNPKKLLDVINKFGVEIIQMTPSKLKMLQMIDKECLYLTSVKMFVIGGEPFAKNIVNWLKKIYDVKIFNFYGPTEATVWALAHEQTNTDVIALGSPILGTGYVDCF